MKPRLVLAVALVVFAGTGCDLTPPNGSGTVTATLVSPNGAEGAAVLDVTGTVESFTAPDGVSLYTTPSGAGTRVIVVRLTPGELSMKLSLSDASKRPQVSVVEVADGDNKLRSSVAGYEVRFQ